MSFSRREHYLKQLAVLRELWRELGACKVANEYAWDRYRDPVNATRAAVYKDAQWTTVIKIKETQAALRRICGVTRKY